MNTLNFLSYKYRIDPAPELVNNSGADKFLEEGTYYFNRDNQCATLVIEKFSVNSKICYWIYVLTGENSPYNPEIIDSENDFQNIPNPRPRKYIEQNKQYFGVLIPVEFTLFSSNKELNKFLQLHYKKTFIKVYNKILFCMSFGNLCCTERDAFVKFIKIFRFLFDIGFIKFC